MATSALRRSFVGSNETPSEVYQVLKPKIQSMADKMKIVLKNSGGLLTSHASYPIAFIYITANKLAESTGLNKQPDPKFEKMLVRAKNSIKPEDLSKVEAIASEIVSSSDGKKRGGVDIDNVCGLLFYFTTNAVITSTILTTYQVVVVAENMLADALNRALGDPTLGDPNLGRTAWWWCASATLAALALACKGRGNPVRGARLIEEEFAEAQRQVAEIERIMAQQDQPLPSIPDADDATPILNIAPNQKTDPVTLDDFEDGEIVIIFNGRDQDPVKKTSLEQWRTAKIGARRSFTWPSSNEVIENSQQLQARRVRISDQGGRKKRKTKKVRKNRKSRTRKH